MSAETFGQQFALAAMDLDDASIGREDGRLVVTRELTDETVSTEDIIDLADEHGLDTVDVTADVAAGEVCVWVGVGEEGEA
ncbi:hypothetical protein [Halosimplex pelagicum]|uniref:Uncharacterized protein n=1 Tax=Halosimplex pelagicum TaxID=869886 RepID=A0A7D5T8J4_9EURY|nr:hypothetical protein [Halosimplex pelagicum]QLH81010.1 hypothetical protein HZS54_04880 [Halosimplex pelagicum]